MTIEDVFTNIDLIANKLDGTKLIQNARSTYEDKIHASQVSEEEKSKLIANFETQLALGTISEILNFVKQLPELDARVKLINAQTNDVKKGELLKDQYILTEKQKQKDINASVNVKNMQAVEIIQNAKFTEIKGLLAIKSNADNMGLRQVDYSGRQMQSFMTNESYSVTATQFLSAKQYIENLDTNKMSYSTAIAIVPKVIT